MSNQDKPQEPWDATKHHPSCSPHDRDLVWHCSQCGVNESAEEWHNAALAAEREKSNNLNRRLTAVHRALDGVAKLEDGPVESIRQLREQLAAEREKAALQIEQLRNLLKKVEPFVEAWAMEDLLGEIREELMKQ